MKTESDQKATVKKLQEQKKQIAEQIGQLSKRCAELRERDDVLCNERKELLQAPVTIDDFIDSICNQVDVLGEQYPNLLSGALSDQDWHAKIIEDPTLAKVSNQQRMNGATNAALASFIYNPRQPSVFFYIFRDTIKESLGRAIREIVDINQAPFKNGKPMKESLARIAEIDQERLQIHAELKELTQGAELFGESI